MTVVLVVDDVQPLAEQYAYDLQRLGDYETVIAGGGAEALDILGREAVDCVILDLEMPGTDGFEVLRAVRDRSIDVPIIVYTGTGDYDRCIEAVRLGAVGFIDKAEPMPRVVREVENALERTRLATEVKSLVRRLGEGSGLIGDSPAMREMAKTIMRVAPIPSPVLVLGESGTGKELVARDLHRLGAAADAAFVAVNCAALPDQLVESELFGHERGAFTGANRLHRGAFETAGGGTLFLDEIGDLPAAAQAKLLRVLEQRELTRVGGERAIPVRARIVAATNRDLSADVAGGRFREDLFYRLNVHVVEVPPLRKRLSDVPLLIDHFIRTTCERFGVRRKRIAPDAVKALTRYEWRRNNVRELRNIVERIVIAAEGDTVEGRHVPTEIRDWEPSAIAESESPGDPPATFQERKHAAERAIVLAALERNEWHITRTAQELGLADHSSLLKIMRRHGIAR